MKKKRLVIIALIVVLLAVGGFCGWKYYTDVYLPNKQITDGDNQQRELFKTIKPDIEEPSEDPGEDDGEDDPFSVLRSYTSDAVGWITINGTVIDYPVVQGSDNTFYLDHGIDKQYLYVGCPFLDYRCKSDFTGFNSIIFAHHMSGYPSMFTEITYYKDQSFMQTHPTGTLLTEDGVHTVRFFAYLIIPNPSFAFVMDIHTKKEKDKYIDDIYENAVYTTVYTSVDLKKNKELHLLLLSTCTYEFRQARGVLAGVIE